MEDTNCLFPIGWYRDENGANVKRIPCKSWKCPVCSKVNKASVLSRVDIGFWDDKVRFLTLTVKADCDDKKITKWFHDFCTMLKKGRYSKSRYGIKNAMRAYPDLKYFWVKELTEKDVRHLHVIIDAYVPQKLIKKLWTIATRGNGKIVFITGNKGKGNILHSIAGYMSKYMVKGADSKFYNERGLDKNERFYSFSRHLRFKRVWRNNRNDHKMTIEVDPTTFFNQLPPGIEFEDCVFSEPDTLTPNPIIAERPISSLTAELGRHVNYNSKYASWWCHRMELIYGPAFTHWWNLATCFDYEGMLERITYMEFVESRTLTLAEAARKLKELIGEI